MSINTNPFDSFNRFNIPIDKLSKMLDKTLLSANSLTPLDAAIKSLSIPKELQMTNQLDKLLSQINDLHIYYPSLNLEIEKNNYTISDNKNSSISVNEIHDVLVLNKIVEGISFKECVDFISYISDFPMLGYKHKIGKIIHSYISKCIKFILSPGIIVYRVRIASERKQIEYTKNEMFEPQYGYPPQNRFSMIGINPLYVSESLDIAIKETEVKKDSKYTWIELEIVKEFALLDITDSQIPLFAQCHRIPESGNNSLKIEYLISNFVSDCARECKFDGIKYKSVINNEINNYVLFYQSPRDFTIKQITGVNFT